MNKRVRKIYCSHSLAGALYLYSGSGEEGLEQVKMMLGLRENVRPLTVFLQGPRGGAEDEAGGYI